MLQNLSSSMFAIVSSSFTIGIFLIFTYHYWKNSYYSSSQFQVYLNYLTTLSTIILALAFIFQIISYRNAQSELTIKAYTDLSSVFLDDILQIFIEHPEMDYYYDDLMGLKKITAYTQRNITLEHKISMLIFARLAKFSIFHQESLDKVHVEKIHNWIKHILDTYLKSDIFKNYWINEYKAKLSGPSTRKFMKETYNL